MWSEMASWERGFEPGRWGPTAGEQSMEEASRTTV